MEEFIQVLIRTFAAFIIIMIVARILGKQTISQMTYHDFVAAITLGAITGNLAFNTKLNHWNLLASLLLFSGIAFIVTFISLKSRKSRKWLSGRPTIVIENGKILEDNLKKLHLTLDTLNQELREKDIFDIQEVEFAVLELNGRLSVLKKPEFRQVLMKDIPRFNGQKETKTTFPVELIMDGIMVHENLEQNQISESWINNELKKRKLTLTEVCYAVKGTNGKLYFDLYIDKIENPINRE
ncbi:DUF421 domain-containing protein [Paenibacillus anseongense]|uniref:DUF421 domain-containing protein n=1 Tax=Paenibacillus anseongense TaxID=2682845 RepID=UPI002DBC34AB|nr:DUF421 domain-containing protein [Paenibacillus anseongense]MEC0270403.1 DUF421 domain-containing protein [Paenibacillus anseongense]